MRNLTVRIPVLAVVGLGLVVTLAFTAPASLLPTLQFALIMGALAVSFQVVFGLLGELSLGHAALFGAGGYTYAVLTSAGTNWLVATLGAIALGGIVAAVMALLTFRLSGIYFSVVTFAFTMILAVIVRANAQLGGTAGIPGVEGWPVIPDILRFSTQTIYAGTIFVLLLVAYSLLKSSTPGVVLELAREDRELALVSGVNVRRLRLVVTVVSGLMAGLVGAFFAQSTRFISPDVFGFQYLIIPLSIVIVGGMRTRTGTVVGVLIVAVIPAFFNLSAVVDQIVAGALLLLAILVAPFGIVPEIAKLMRRMYPGKRATQPPTSDAPVPDAAKEAQK
ncbi:branched-chain amino acid ABC transporter permease [Microcella sp.]|uniref:branched-chain amino acid ABC transporter permease n=1 Tax=Microcella sp. TaxID=1913979 RepID=UPI0025611D9F|nr:branched-chain amino acid ABC transporter permease [Microcella sp.]MBX9472390.1 branched-chain amino acid ABC transporter permease [Microcella sp.]